MLTRRNYNEDWKPRSLTLSIIASNGHLLHKRKYLISRTPWAALFPLPKMLVSKRTPIEFSVKHSHTRRRRMDHIPSDFDAIRIWSGDCLPWKLHRSVTGDFFKRRLKNRKKKQFRPVRIVFGIYHWLIGKHAKGYLMTMERIVLTGSPEDIPGRTSRRLRSSRNSPSNRLEAIENVGRIELCSPWIHCSIALLSRTERIPKPIYHGLAPLF